MSAEETILGGNQFRKDSQRLIWNSTDRQHNNSKRLTKFPDVELQPMEIRTFIFNLVRDNRLVK